jgi:hypothetical protein
MHWLHPESARKLNDVEQPDVAFTAFDSTDVNCGAVSPTPPGVPETARAQFVVHGRDCQTIRGGLKFAPEVILAAPSTVLYQLQF